MYIYTYIYTLSCFILKLVRMLAVWEFNHHNWLLIAGMLLTPSLKKEKWLIPESKEEKSSLWPQETGLTLTRRPQDHWELAWGSHLCHGVLLLDINNLTEHQHQTSPHDVVRQKNTIILTKHRQKQDHSIQLTWTLTSSFPPYRSDCYFSINYSFSLGLVPKLCPILWTHEL